MRRRGCPSCLPAWSSHFPTDVQSPSLGVTTRKLSLSLPLSIPPPLGKLLPLSTWMWSYPVISTRPLHPNTTQ